jgi:hypothetical protein
VQTTVARMQSQPTYAAAQRDETGALRPLVKPGKVPWHFDAVVPVSQYDCGRRNALRIYNGQLDTIA